MALTTAAVLDLSNHLGKIDLDSLPEGDDVLRASLLASAQALCRRLESPWENIGAMVWLEPMRVMSIRVGIDMGLFDKVNELSHTKPSSETIATALGKDLSSVRRILRALGAYGVIKEVGQEVYQATPFSHALAADDAKGAFGFMVNTAYPGYLHAPEFIRDNDFVLPTEPSNCPWSEAFRSTSSLFDWFSTRPEQATNLARMLRGYGASKKRWYEYYPMHEVLARHDGKSPIMVDVGGGIGYDVEGFREKFPETSGKLVLEDRPDVIAEAIVGEGVSKIGYDFFTPQPVNGALFYCLHQILHDWPDEKAKQILLQVKAAMRPGYSRLFIDDIVVQSRHPTSTSTAFDLGMMVLFGAKERDEGSWNELLESVGMRLVRIWDWPGAARSVLEVEPADA